MQGNGSFGRKRIITIIVCVLLAVAGVYLDQLTKRIASEERFSVTVIDNFFYLSYSENTGAGFSFLADKPWGQTLFKILTPVALVAFIVFLVFSVKNKYSFISIGLSAIISGTVGNFIDRVVNGFVVDFLSFKFGTYYFPTFNVADVCLTVGVIMLIVHFLFIDKNAVFKSKVTTETDVSEKEDNSDKSENGNG